MREFYLRADHQPGAVLVLECDDVTEAERLVAALPMAKAGLLDFELILCALSWGLDGYLRIRHSVTREFGDCLMRFR